MRDLDDYVIKYAEEPFEREMVRVRKKVVVEQCVKYNASSVLEVGCGLEPLFADYKAYERMTIVEPSRTFAENARMLAADAGVPNKVRVIVDYIESASTMLLESKDSFDFIVVSSLLHEVDESKALLNAIKNLCGRNTIVHINVPNAKSLHRLIALESGMISDEHDLSSQQIKMQRRRTYDMESLQNEINDAGFDIVSSGFYFIKPFTHAQMQACLDANIIDKKVLKGLEGISKYIPEYGSEMYINAKVQG